MRRAVGTAAQEIQEEGVRGGFRGRAAMVTLTYRHVAGYRGRHMNELVVHYRKWLLRRGFQLRYVWVAELQERGAVHYHLVLWIPRGLTPPKPDKQGWWKHGSTRVEWARKPVGYLIKYTSKGDGDTEFPKGLRLHGRGGLTLTQKLVVRWWVLPRYVRQAFGTHLEKGVPFRVRGGGWCNDWGEFVIYENLAVPPTSSRLLSDDAPSLD